MRKICYVTGTRADFGLMVSTLQLLDQDPSIDLSLCVTGSHFSKHFTSSYDDIVATKIRIAADIPVNNDASTHAGMAEAIGQEIIGLTAAFAKEKFNCILVLGDRGEPLAAAIAAVHLNLPVIHIHGGELSGTVDESVRHAISKLSHYHFVATEKSKERLIKMGESPNHIFVTGAPGLDGLTEKQFQSKDSLCQSVSFNPEKKIALFVYHPIVQDTHHIQDYIHHAMQAALENQLQLICLTPNTDAGGNIIRDALDRYASNTQVRLINHMPRDTYLSWMQAADLMLGNSSSGIIEAASFHLPTINIGTRQQAREKSSNVMDSATDKNAIDKAIKLTLSQGKETCSNVYGNGKAGERMLALLKELPLHDKLLNKLNAY